MGTEARIVLYASSRDSADAAARAAFSRIAELEQRLSDYRRGSELSRAVRQPAGAVVPLSDDLFTVLRAALALSAETNGAFDVTVGTLTAQRRAASPQGHGAQACATAAIPGWRSIVLDTGTRTMRLTKEGVRIDLGGIGKGYAADEALRVLRDRGVTRAMIALGGDIVAGDAPPGTPGWTIAVRGADGADVTMTVANEAVSTSGDSEQYVDSAGVRYSHVIDPRRGAPLTSRITATVRGPTGFLADGWSTAVTVMDAPERARWIAAHPEGRFHVRADTAGPPPAPAAAPPCTAPNTPIRDSAGDRGTRADSVPGA
jgi:thiamine biosynthesis lipoprotein